MDNNTFNTAAPEAPSLTLDPFSDSTAAQAAPAATATAQSAIESNAAATPAVLDDSILTEQEKKIVNDFSSKIDITNTATVLQYGAAAQQKIAQFSDAALANVRTKDFGELGEMISSLVVELKGIDNGENDKGFKSFFKKQSNKIASVKARYDKASVNVNAIADVLQKHQIILLKDASMLDKMYEQNLAYFKELTMYIIAGRRRLQKERETTLQELIAKAKQSGLPEDAQKANDFSAMCDRFEKKLYDLELTRMVSIQMAPQIRMVQNNDTLMSEKIQSTIVNTIPLWKSQMVITLGIAHASQAMEAQRQVSNMTNELLKRNAEALKMGTVEVAKESERGIVDIETLTQTNQMLMSTLDEVQQIQRDGREKRRAAEIELRRIEGELRTKLLNINENK